MATTKLETEHIFDFNGEYKLAKYPPKEDGYYITVKCGLGGIYYCLNDFKDGKWQVLSTDDSYVIAYTRDPLPKEKVDSWLKAQLNAYKNNKK